MTRHLLVVSLGPVQDFIASARRCQDLWFGSWLLSDLARATAKGIEIEAGERSLIFPSELRDEKVKVSVANKIVAVLPANREPAKIAEYGRAAMMQHLEALAARLFDKVTGERWDRELAMAQVRTLMEYVWVAVAFDNDGDYARARREAETLLIARKNSKDWGPVPWKPIFGAPKSSIDGQRESVLSESLYADLKTKALSAEKLRKNYFVKKSERLCGVGLLKRIGQERDLNGDVASKPAFHSATHVTAGPLLVRLERSGERGHDALARYHETLRQLGIDVELFRIRLGEQAFSTPRDPIAKDTVSADELPKIPRTFAQRGEESGLDGYLLFEDRLLDVLEMYAPSYATKAPKEREDLVRAARAALKQFFKAIGHDESPTAYYALLLADGDQMGAAIDQLPHIEDHRALSGALEKFALGCRKIVESNGGSFIYSGGDDVLALLPLHTALACADELRRCFSDSIRLAYSSLASVPTLSVGLGIAHHLDAMSEVRALAKQAESAAKRKRNSLGIAMSKRSGATVEITGPWDESPPLHERIKTWCSLFRAEDLPDGVAFELEEAVVPFEIRDPADSKTPADVEALNKVIFALTKRVIGRKRSDRGKELLDTTTAGLLSARFETDEDPILVTKKLSSELQVARLFLKAYDSAWGEVSR